MTFSFFLKVTESALKTAELVQKKYEEYQNFYAKEMERLNTKMKELVDENFAKQQESERTVKNVSLIEEIIAL